MDLRCPHCNNLYDRQQYIPHFIPCGCDLCAVCVQKFVLKSTTGAGSTSSRPPTPMGSTNTNNNMTKQQQQQQAGRSSVMGFEQQQQQQQQSSLVAPVVVTSAFKCARGHITPAATLNACPPCIAHRIAEQVRDKSQTCPLHARRPLDFWCVPCRRALCGVCAVSHKEDSNCILPARPINQCTGEILKMSYECKGALDTSLRGVQTAQQTTTRMLKAGANVPLDLMNACLTAVEQFQQRLLKSVDAVWKEHVNEMKNVRGAHAALEQVAKTLENYKEKVVQGERLCDDTGEQARLNGGVDPLPLAATMAQIEEDRVIKFPLRLGTLRGVDGIHLDPSGATVSAAWQDPFSGKLANGELIPYTGTQNANAAAAAALLDKASPARNRVVTPNRRDAELSALRSRPLPSPGTVNAEQVGAFGHAPLGLLSVADVLSLGLRADPLSSSYAGTPPAAAAAAANGNQNQHQQQAGRKNDSKQNSRNSTPQRTKSNSTPPPADNSNNGPYVQLNRYPPRGTARR